MKYRRLGGTELELSEVGFDMRTVATDDYGKIVESLAERLLQEAFELGLTSFDGADIYGKGYGDELLAKAFPKMRYDIVIGASVGYDFYDRPPFEERQAQRFDAAYIRYACEQSLRRLKCDYVDLLQLHHPGPDAIESDELFETLEALVKEGKARCWGVRLATDGDWFEAGQSAMVEREVGALQIVYTLARQEQARRLLPIAAERGLGVIAGGATAERRLGVDGLPAAAAIGAGDADAQVALSSDDASFLWQDSGRTKAQAGALFALSQPSIASVLPVIGSLAELREIAAIAELAPLTEDELGQLEELWGSGASGQQNERICH